AIPVGAKPCGGPWRYLVYSNKNVNEDKLNTLVSKHKSVNQSLNQQSGMASDCMAVLPPSVACVAKQCITKASKMMVH
ncbi:MAG: hypothetical protein OEX00_02250, partial [Gammaproteobacteria bacterium]|nr:hypothetical protein [Gammaproteobacteria bacterium]